jgi:hypothetical protein
MTVLLLLPPAASAANGMTPVSAVCKYFSLSDAQQVFGPTASRVPGAARGTCQYAAPPATLKADSTPRTSPGVIVQAWRDPKPRGFAVKPTPEALLVRVGPVNGWYVAPPTATDTNAVAGTGTLAFYEKGRLFHVGAMGTKDDLATSAQVGSLVLHHL